MNYSNPIEVHILKDESTTFKNYTYGILDPATNALALIDPACERDKILNLIKRTGATLRYVLLTHTHFDHIRELDWVMNTFHVPVYLSKTEAHYYDFYVPNMLLLEDEAQLNLGQTKLTAFLTPGHSKGSMCYQIEQALFTGDTLFIEGCGLCTASGGSPHEMFESLQKLKSLLTPQIYVYPGHCYSAPVGQTAKYVLDHNIYLALNDKESFTNFRMRKNQKNLFHFI